MSRTHVVVGHGLSPKGRGWGQKIDKCSCVIRMWNWHWQNLLDYGERYDYGFFEINSSEVARYYAHNKCTPRFGYVATELHSNIGHKRNTRPLPFPTQVVSSVPWEAAGRSLGGAGVKGRLVLTRGVRAAAWAIDRLTPKDRLVLVGFDNVYAGTALEIEEGYPPEFVACPAGFPFRSYKGGSTKFGNHDYAVEGPLLKLLAERKGVELVHAQDVW